MPATRQHAYRLALALAVAQLAVAAEIHAQAEARRGPARQGFVATERDAATAWYRHAVLADRVNRLRAQGDLVEGLDYFRGGEWWAT